MSRVWQSKSRIYCILFTYRLDHVEDQLGFQQEEQPFVESQDTRIRAVIMSPMLNVLFSPDYGLNHDCGEPTHYNCNFDATHQVLNYIMSSIYQVYHPGQDLYEENNQCQHGVPLQFMVMEIVRHDPPDPNDDDDDPVVLTIDIFHHQRSYIEMIPQFFSIPDIVNRVSDLVL